MLRQFSRRAALVAVVVVLGSSVPGCGIKGPLAARPPRPRLRRRRSRRRSTIRRRLRQRRRRRCRRRPRRPNANRERFRVTPPASCAPSACRCRRSPSATARPATSIRAPCSTARVRGVRRGVRRRPAPRLLRDEGQLQPRDPRSVRAPRQRLRHRVRRRARARARRRRRSAARSCSPASARATPKWRPRSPPASCASTSNRRASCDHLAAVAARMGKRAPISFRVNPDVDPQTHPYIATGLKESKFGVAFGEAHALYRRAARMPSIAVRGIDMHIGSQITELAPYREAAARMLSPRRRARGGWHRARRTSTSAAGSASATATRRRSRSAITPRWCATCSGAAASGCCSSRDAASSATPACC